MVRWEPDRFSERAWRCIYAWIPMEVINCRLLLSDSFVALSKWRKYFTARFILAYFGLWQSFLPRKRSYSYHTHFIIIYTVSSKYFICSIFTPATCKYCIVYFVQRILQRLYLSLFDFYLNFVFCAVITQAVLILFDRPFSILRFWWKMYFYCISKCISMLYLPMMKINIGEVSVLPNVI